MNGFNVTLDISGLVVIANGVGRFEDVAVRDTWSSDTIRTAWESRPETIPGFLDLVLNSQGGLRDILVLNMPGELLTPESVEVGLSWDYAIRNVSPGIAVTIGSFLYEDDTTSALDWMVSSLQVYKREASQDPMTGGVVFSTTVDVSFTA